MQPTRMSGRRDCNPWTRVFGIALPLRSLRQRVCVIAHLIRKPVPPFRDALLCVIGRLGTWGHPEQAFGPCLSKVLGTMNDP